MNKLVKEAMDLYPKLNTVIRHLIDSELDYKDSVAIVEAQQLAKRIMESDGDIVFLGEVWHDNKHIPQSNMKIIAIKSSGDTFCGVCNVKNGVYRASIASDITSMSSWDDVSKWAYVDDLMPKGGEE